jgi:hypothetical protein
MWHDQNLREANAIGLHYEVFTESLRYSDNISAQINETKTPNNNAPRRQLPWESRNPGLGLVQAGTLTHAGTHTVNNTVDIKNADFSTVRIMDKSLDKLTKYRRDKARIFEVLPVVRMA